jgi:hypothetical protein
MACLRAKSLRCLAASSRHASRSKEYPLACGPLPDCQSVTSQRHDLHHHAPMATSRLSRFSALLLQCVYLPGDARRGAMRLEFSAPLSPKRVAFPIQAPETRCQYLQTHSSAPRPRLDERRQRRRGPGHPREVLRRHLSRGVGMRHAGACLDATHAQRRRTGPFGGPARFRATARRSCPIPKPFWSAKCFERFERSKSVKSSASSASSASAALPECIAEWPR